jgi:signal transduction histidine kinase
VLEIYSELLNNIEKHSYAEKVIIKIEVNTDYLSILIIDNGKDFDLDKFDVQHSNGYGLKIIKSLVEKIDADLEIKSMPFQGSYRKLVIKL